MTRIKANTPMQGMIRLIATCAILLCRAQATSLPPPTGPYNIGMSKHVIEHYNSHDLLAPNNISTGFLATIYYPTRQKPNFEPRSYIDPELVAILEPQLNHTSGFLSVTVQYYIFIKSYGYVFDSTTGQPYSIHGRIGDPSHEQPLAQSSKVENLARLRNWKTTTGVFSGIVLHSLCHSVTLSTVTASLQLDAPYLEGPIGQSAYPTLLFGPGGGGPPVEGNTILISELVSHGYTVIGLDHPFEQPFIRYPNGTGVVGGEIYFNNTDTLRAIYDTRLEDTTAFLDHFPKLVQNLGAPFNTTHIGSFGYSLGGAAAVGSLYDDNNRLISGLNLDGSLLGQAAVNDTKANVKKPVLFLGQELHTGRDDVHDITWGTFPLWQTDYFGKFLVNGTLHHDFCDYAFWKTIEPTDPTTGSIDGNRQIAIMNVYVKAFIDFALLGKNSSMLNGPSAEWPDVVFYE